MNKLLREKFFRCVWQVPSKLHGRDDGRSSPGRDLSCSRQHLCHRHAGGFLGLFLSSIFPKMAILSRGFQKPFDKGLLSQVSPEDIGFWCFLIAFIFVVLSLVRSQLISLFTIYPLVARLPIALSRPLNFSPSMPGLEGGHS